MFYCILLLLGFSLAFGIRGYRTLCCWVFLIMLLGMILSFLSIFMYVSLLSDYTWGDSLFFSIDSLFFRFVRGSVKLSFPALARLLNAGMGLYLLAVPLFVFEFTDRKRRVSVKVFFLFLFIVYYILYYDPETAQRISLRYHTGPEPLKFSWIIDLVHQINQIGLLVYLFYPSWLLYVYREEIGVGFIRRQILLLAVCLILMTVLFYGVIFFSPFVFSTDNALDYGFWIYSDITGIKTWYMVLPLLTASALSLAMFSFFNFRLGSAVHLFTDKGIDSSIAQMNEILSDSLHSQKNLLFSIYITASGGDESPERAEAALKKIELLSRDSLDKVSEQLDALREIRLKVKTENITDLIDGVLERISFPQNVRAFKNYRMKERCDAVSKVDQYHISQVFVNILNNAFEAIEEAHRDEGRIVITVRDQFQWVLISVEDNGTGIRKKALKRVFEPWYSGKGGRFNRGLGLSYAYKIIKAHYGLIRIESRYGEGAVVYIMLPKTEETA